MSKTRVYLDSSLEVMNRFYEAVDTLVAEKKIRGVATYCRLYGIDRRHFYNQRNNPDKGYFQIGWAIPLISEYKFRADWLLLGKGSPRKA